LFAQKLGISSSTYVSIQVDVKTTGKTTPATTSFDKRNNNKPPYSFFYLFNRNLGISSVDQYGCYFKDNTYKE
jgi:hypothetical protein